jgi:antitoxin HicB
MKKEIEQSANLQEANRYLRRPYARMILPESDGSFRGEIMEFPGCIATGDSAPETLATLEEVAQSWLLSALERGQNIPEPIDNNNDFSGRLVLRIPKSLHKRAAWIAEREGVSLNNFITTSLSGSVGERNASVTALLTSAVTPILSTAVSYVGCNYMTTSGFIASTGLLENASGNLSGSMLYQANVGAKNLALMLAGATIAGPPMPVSGMGNAGVNFSSGGAVNMGIASAVTQYIHIADEPESKRA